MSSSDNYFGPQLPHIFDFTILFEQSILSILPTSLFIVLAPFRLWSLRSHETRVASRRLLWSKLATIAVYFCLQVTLVALWSIPSAPRTQTSIAEASVGVVGALAIGTMSYAEHTKSVRPGSLLNSFLFVSILLDIALARTFFIRPGLRAVAGVFMTSLVAKALLLVLEESPKRLLATEKDIARETMAGIISRSVFWWLNSLFLNGARLLLRVDDIETIDMKFSSEKLMVQLERVWDGDPKESEWSLMKCTFLAYKWQFAAGILPRLLFSGFTFAQPFLINSIIDFVGGSPEQRSDDIAGGLIGATALAYIGLAVSNVWYKHMTYQLLTMYRGGLASLVFKKTLKLQTTSIRESAPVTLMSTDIETIVQAGTPLHDIWASFLELPVAIYLLYQHFGVPSLFILVPAVVTTVAGGLISPAMGPARVNWNKGIQERVGSASSMLSQIKGIKMMGLADFFHDLLRDLRISELKLSVNFRWILVQLQTLAIISEELTPVIVILAAIFWTKTDEGLSVAEAFTSLSIISIASVPLLHILVSIMSLFGAIGCFTRLQTFLQLDERQDSREMPNDASQQPTAHESTDIQSLARSESPSSGTCVELAVLQQSSSKATTGNGSTAVITIENATFSSGDDVEVLHDISMTVNQGSLCMVVGRVGCGKSSLLKAILGELTMNKGRVVANTTYAAYCDQIPWLQNTTIRDNIVGQSSLDEKWLSTVIRACALDQDVSVFPLGDMTIAGTGGVALSGGQKQRVALARAVYSRQNLVVLDDVFSGLDTTTSKTVFQKLLGIDGLLRRDKTTVIMATNHVNFLPAADCITMLEEGRIVRRQVSYDSVEPSVWGILQNNSDTSGAVSEAQDREPLAKKTTEQPQNDNVSPLPKPEPDMSRQTGDIDCYKIYINSMGWTVLTIISIATVAHVGLQKMPQVWLRLWTQKGTGSGDLAYMGAYLSFTFASMVVGTLDIAYYLIIAIPKSANHLHELLLTAVIRAPLYFFTTSASGTILNRFSQDMTLIDNTLPMSFYATFYLIIRTLAETGLIASGATYVSAVIPLCFIALYFVQKYYLRTSRQIRFLDLEMKSPLYAQFTETLAGLSTIRAFGWAPDFMRENHVRLDTSQKPFYMMFCIQRWLQVVLDLFVAGIALVLVVFALKVSSGVSKGAIGLAMVNLIGFNQTLTTVIDLWTRLETSLGAIARLRSFIDNTPNENQEQEKEAPPADWPSRGSIELDNVTASYSDGTEPVLRGVSLKIQPGQKVGLCGRSGSGKSSLILTLARLLELRSGTIRIDNVDLSTLPRQEIRSRLTTLPQDAITLPGTIRHNLVPKGSIHADEPLVLALRRTAIWPAIEARGGLDADMENVGFSAGQLQLFCLARAILHRSAVVLLDEATSSVDSQTDMEIRHIIDEEMKDRTVIEVAHRLEVVRECDVIVVLSDGTVQEVGHPEELLAKPSAFRTLWESQGL